MIAVLARLVNFAILVGTLVYFLRRPFQSYLQGRATEISGELAQARELKAAAAAQLEEIARKMEALPREIEALGVQGAQEIAAEEARMLAAVAAERERMLDDTRREIEFQTRIAERALVSRAADLAVSLAASRMRETMTDADRTRLIDRYVAQLS